MLLLNQRSGLGGGRGGGGRPVQFVIQGNTYQELVAVARHSAGKSGSKTHNWQMLDHDYKETVPQVLVEINSERAADLGISVGAVGQALEAMLGGRSVTTFLDRGKEYDVILEGADNDFAKPGSISNVYVRAKESGKLIPLDNLVVLKRRSHYIHA